MESKTGKLLSLIAETMVPEIAQHIEKKIKPLLNVLPNWSGAATQPKPRFEAINELQKP
jgi:hypothetical protein